MKISVLIPCHNEEKSIRACVESCLAQTRLPDQILVVNDGSRDRSAEILAAFGDKIEVLTIPVATGNKSFAQERGLERVTGDIFIATDGDTVFHPDFVKYIEEDFEKNPKVVAVGGYVKSLKHNWLTACRELDYVIGQDIFKVAQAYIGALFVIPGCAGAFKTQLFRRHIKFEHDTLTEDLDFTYKFHQQYFQIMYDRRAVVFTQDPATLMQYVNQMRRWYCGGWQNLRKHWRIIKKPNNSLQLALSYTEGFIFSILLFVFPFLNFAAFISFYVIYVLVLWCFAVSVAIRRRRSDLVFIVPLYVLLIYVNALIFLEQFWKEIVMRKKNLVWFHPERRNIHAT
jgi:cellulose synthase/poly-beta-1,6-N-acetylglucosamine synthase-like glycosyltransferase